MLLQNLCPDFGFACAIFVDVVIALPRRRLERLACEVLLEVLPLLDCGRLVEQEKLLVGLGELVPSLRYVLYSATQPGSLNACYQPASAQRSMV